MGFFRGSGWDRLEKLDQRAGIRLERVSKDSYRRYVIVCSFVGLAMAAGFALAHQWAAAGLLLAGALFGFIDRGHLLYVPWLVWPRRRR